MISYRATLDVPVTTLVQVTAWLHLHRETHDTRPWQRAASCRTQAIMVLRWFRDATALTTLARDAGISIATAYRYLHEAIDVIADHAPDLLDVLQHGIEQGWTHLCLDGTLIQTTRSSAKSKAGHDLWYSGKHKQHGDPLYGIRTILRCGAEKLTDKHKARLERAIAADPRHEEVHIAWQAAQQLRRAYHAENLAAGRAIAEKVLTSFPTCPIPEIKRLGKTLRQWNAAFLAYFTTASASNGGSEAINGLIELHRRIARDFRNRDNYRLRMLLVAGGLNPETPCSTTRPHLKCEEPSTP